MGFLWYEEEGWLGPVEESALVVVRKPQETVWCEEEGVVLASPALAALRALRHLHTWPCCNPLACSPQLDILWVTSV
ncbi:hypothetical protein RchiOBHm_Chr5g0012331 [Rosa chinensis]|uniref:Uncharacterized protein n=1 Tax=Rosa chinensis TaxID=74649 RepID=A0A2P6Q537_ROSCH|nr:hypothetical protein RchiOBHm_Chr5g0012331 [Rosa chinensis]